MRAAVRLLFAAVVCFAQPAGNSVISGTVIDGSSGDPVRKAIVTVTWDGTPRSWATVQTNSSGEFRVEGLPNGNYTVQAFKAQLGSGFYGAANFRELGESIPLADAETRQGVKIRLFRTASITGHIFDPDGDPVSGVQIDVMTTTRNLGERVLATRGSYQADEKGEYRISNLQPGQYYLKATPREPSIFLARDAKVVSPEFYGGTRYLKDATLFTVHSGDVLTGIDFHLHAEPLAEIHGHLSGVPGAGVNSVSLRPDGEWFERDWSRGAGTSEPGHRFQFEALPSGRYRVEAQTEIDNKAYFASQIVDAQPGMSDIELTLRPGVSLNGHIRIEGSGAQPGNSFSVSLCSRGTPVDKDGKFTFDQMPPDEECAININPLPRGMFLKSAKLGDQDVRFKRFRAPSGTDSKLEIVISTNTARLEGEVDAVQKGKAGILLVPTGEFHNLARFYYSVDSDDDGKFKMMGIAPGKYRMYALEKTAAALFRDPDIADKLGETGEEIELAEGSVFQAHPKLVPLEKIREALP